MTVTAYKAATYGFKIQIPDRDKYFSRDWETAIVELPVEGGFERVECNVAKKSFWNSTCHELISSRIGAWFASKGFLTWEKGYPPKFELTPMGGNVFRITKYPNGGSAN